MWPWLAVLLAAGAGWAGWVAIDRALNPSSDTGGTGDRAAMQEEPLRREMPRPRAPQSGIPEPAGIGTPVESPPGLASAPSAPPPTPATAAAIAPGGAPSASPGTRQATGASAAKNAKPAAKRAAPREHIDDLDRRALEAILEKKAAGAAKKP